MALGFDAVGFASADGHHQTEAWLAEWLAAGHHGSMTWMEDRPERRATPAGLWPDVRSVVLVGMSYAPAGDPLAVLDRPERGAISVYAQRRDYHDVLKGRLKELAGFLASRGGGDVKVFVDTAPVMEKPLAEAAGLGWQGKNSLLVTRETGCWLFLGAIYTTLDLPPDTPGSDHCGSCTRCLDICPTDAFPAPRVLDSRRCIAYLTIEHTGVIPEEFRKAIGNRVFGCDDCLAVCPWNSFAETAREAKLAVREALDSPLLRDLVQLDDATFRQRFAQTPVKRTGRDRFIRNVLIAIGNGGDATLAPEVTRLLADPSPLVRGMAVWALARLLAPADMTALSARHLPREADDDVRAEWLAAQAPGVPSP